MRTQHEALVTWGAALTLLALSPSTLLASSLWKRMDIAQFKPVANAGSNFQDPTTHTPAVLSMVQSDSGPGFQSYQETKILRPQVIQTEHGPATVSGRINRGAKQSAQSFSNGGSSGSLTQSTAYQHTQTSVISHDLMAILAMSGLESKPQPIQLAESSDKGPRYLQYPKSHDLTYPVSQKGLSIEDVSSPMSIPSTTAADTNINNKSRPKASSAPGQYSLEFPHKEGVGSSTGGKMQNQNFHEHDGSSSTPQQYTVQDPDDQDVSGSPGSYMNTKPFNAPHFNVLSEKKDMKTEAKVPSNLDLDEQIKKLQISNLEQQYLKEYVHKKWPDQKNRPVIYWTDEELKNVYNEWKHSPKPLKFRMLNQWNKFKTQISSLFQAFLKLVKYSKK